MSNRYSTIGTQIPQPVRKILPAGTDILYTLKHGERLDNVVQRYYNDPTLSWILMCANRNFQNEFEISAGTQIRIPFPLSRVYTAWQISNDQQ